jgi:hypothetical protein
MNSDISIVHSPNPNFNAIIRCQMPQAFRLEREKQKDLGDPLDPFRGCHQRPATSRWQNPQQMTGKCHSKNKPEDGCCPSVSIMLGGELLSSSASKPQRKIEDPPAARVAPSGENDTDGMSSSLVVVTPDARSFPLGEKEMQLTCFVGPCKRVQLPFLLFHSRTIHGHNHKQNIHRLVKFHQIDFF